MAGPAELDESAVVRDAVHDRDRELVVGEGRVHLPDSTLIANVTLLLSRLSESAWQGSRVPSASKGT